MEEQPAEQGNRQSQALEPVEQDTIEFHGELIIEARLADGRIAVVVRWICESLHLDSQAQVRRIQRTSTTASELVRIRVQTPGGRQTMPALTLRGFSPWIIGINPNEVRNDDPQEAERIRALIVAYQEEAKDVLYQHFVNKQRLGLTALTEAGALVVPTEPLAEPVRPAADAPDEEQATYYEHLAAWALLKAAQHSQQWRGRVQIQLESLQTQLEAEKAVTDLIPEIIERLGPETITPQHQEQVQAYVRRLSEATGRTHGAIYADLKTVFQKPRYQELLESEWPQVSRWFEVQIQRARQKRGGKR